MTHDARLDRPRQVVLRAFDVSPSCLGFGCASLGSRIGATAGLRALAEAYDAGVTWYDVAPAYGTGDAEPLLAQFLKGRRDRIVLTTKVGIAPPARLGAMKLAYALGRPVIGAMGGLRRAFRRTSATRNRRLAIDGGLVERSLSASLKRLGTDRVDVFALHDPQPEEVVRDDVLRALERAIASGRCRHVGVAGRHDSCEAAIRIGAPYTFVQTSTQAFAEAGDTLAASPHVKVLHSVFGVGDRRDRLRAALERDPDKRRRLAAHGYAGDLAHATSDLLLDTAFALNPGGIVLASMFGTGHLTRNLARADAVRPDSLALLREMLA